MASVKLEKIFLGTSDSLPIVNILHLSDLHFGIEKAEKSKYRWRPTSKEHWDMLHTLIETLLDRNLVPNGWQPDIVAISGDIAWSGQEEEYAEFQKFLDKLLPVLRNNPEKKVLICPGNHDIIRDRVYNKHTGMISRPIKNKPTFTENPDIQIPEITYEAVVEERWHHFEHFVKACCENEPEKLCRSITFPEWPWLHFLLLNSAWDCRGKHDEGTLRIGIEIAEKIYADIDPSPNDNDTVVAIFHHPSFEISEPDLETHIECPHQWLHESERVASHLGKTCITDFLGTRTNIILNGHVHRPKDPGRFKGKPIHFVSGTVYSNDSYRCHCRIIQLRGTDDPLCRDLWRDISAAGQKWRVSQPYDPAERDRNPWDAKFDGLADEASATKDQYQAIFPKLANIIFQKAIELNPNIVLSDEMLYKFIAEVEEELCKYIDEIENSPTLLRKKKEE